MTRRWRAWILLPILWGQLFLSITGAQEMPENLQTKNLVAWCLVPFDAAKRGPQARAEMLSELGLRHFAYDWREEHIPTWDDELKALKSHAITLSAFWCSSSLTPASHPGNVRILEFLKRNSVQTELWFMLPSAELEKISSETERLDRAAQALREFAQAAKPLGCRVALYNHGGWAGQPSTMVKIMRRLEDVGNVGIVYNFHHAHEDLAQFPQALADLKPYLLCLNLNGMTKGGPKIQTIGEGELDAQVLRWILASDYQGPIGILDHRNELDARKSLQQNLDGLAKLWEQVARE